MSTRHLITAGLMSLALATGCSKEEPEATEPVEMETPEPIEEAEETAAAEPAEPPSADSLPIPEDFADEAADEVTKDNYKQQVAKLEQELAEEPAP